MLAAFQSPHSKLSTAYTTYVQKKKEKRKKNPTKQNQKMGKWGMTPPERDQYAGVSRKRTLGKDIQTSKPRRAMALST